jgi:hypothetical protein
MNTTYTAGKPVYGETKQHAVICPNTTDEKQEVSALFVWAAVSGRKNRKTGWETTRKLTCCYPHQPLCGYHSLRGIPHNSGTKKALVRYYKALRRQVLSGAVSVII